MKIVTTKTEQIEIEREINIPFYTRSGNIYHKIQSETKAIKVCDFVHTGPMVTVETPQSAFNSEWDEITESEFEKILQKTLNQIIN